MLNPSQFKSNEEFDNTTGFPIQEFQDQVDVNQATEKIIEASTLKEMQATKGWKILEQYLLEQSKYFTNQLKLEEDFNKIKKLQALVIAFEFLPLVFEKVFMDAEKASEIITQFTEGQALQG